MNREKVYFFDRIMDKIDAWLVLFAQESLVTCMVHQIGNNIRPFQAMGVLRALAIITINT